MKVFGTSLQGMRSSSVLMFLMIGISVYYSTKQYFPKASTWMMFLVYTSPMLILLTNGRKGMDHNDIAFISWISISFWVFITYTRKPMSKYALVIGLACGAAMLTKWLAGSLILFSLGFTYYFKRTLVLKVGVISSLPELYLS